MFPSRRPHMPFLERPSRQAVFGREINRLLPSMHPLRACATVDPGRSPRLLGFPRGQSALMPHAMLSRAASAILPWALWCSLRYVRHAPATVFFRSGRRMRALASGRIVCMPLREPPTPGTAMSMRTCAARIRSWALANVWRRPVGRRRQSNCQGTSGHRRALQRIARLTPFRPDRRGRIELPV